MFGTKCEWLLSLYERVGYDILLWFLLSTPSSNKRSVENTMGEVMICRGGRGSGSGAGGSSNKNYGEGGGTLTTLVFTDNQMWTVPSNIIDNLVSVRIFGGGGGGASGTGTYDGYAGGGSGWMNNDILKLSAGEIINIVIGAGGAGAKCYWDDGSSASTRTTAFSGGTTSFGGYLSASGGAAGAGEKGGAGGAGGGGGDLGSGGRGYQFGGGAPGGDGGVWGGGGGGLQKGGNGGTYGGGGGCYWGKTPGIGGTYGGNSGFNGTNTVSWTNVDIDSAGSYITGNGECQKVGSNMFGGGGFGGNGGAKAVGGGGGYGGAGGTMDIVNIPNDDVCGGGGGGYGKNATGGTGSAYWNKHSWAYSASGGGGGYYCPGKGYGKSGYAYGGGGAIINGVEYSSGGNGIWVNSYSSGWKNGTNGIQGVCIIQFYRDL